MKTFALILTGLVAGFLIGWYFAPRPMRYYVTTKDIEIEATNGDTLTLPAGTPMASDAPLLDSVDLGWWGFVPVYFHTSHVAIELGVEPSEQPKSIASYTLDATGGGIGVTGSSTNTPSDAP